MLEDSQASLASMLTSKYIGPLKDEAASWAAKLLSVSEVIEQWLTVQNHWVHLESVFSLPTTKKDLPQEAKRFASIDKTWTKLMKKSYDIKNVIQVCGLTFVFHCLIISKFYEVCNLSLNDIHLIYFTFD